MQKRYLYISIDQLHRESRTGYTEEVPIYTNQSITQRRYASVHRRGTYICQSIKYTGGTYIYQSINYTEEVRQCIQKRYLFLPISQLHRGGKIIYAEEVTIYTNQSITQKS